MNELDFSGKTVAFNDSGDGPAVVFIHGFCEQSSVWESQLPVLRQSGYRTILIDLPGFGASDVFPEISIAGMAQAVEAVLSFLSVEKAILLGHSLGGYVALSFLDQFPFRTEAIGLIHSHPFEDTPEKKQGREKSIDFIKQHGVAPYLKQLFPGLFPPQYVTAHPETIDLLVRQAEGLTAEGIISGLRAMAGRPDMSNVLELCNVPALFVMGIEDQLIPPTEAMLGQTSLPDLSVVHLLEGIGHMSMFEAPEQLQHILKEFTDFVRQQSSGTARFHFR